MDREKVIKGLECCHNKNMLWQHDQCPYHGFDEDCESNLHADALALLKEQEEKRTPKLIIHGSMEEYWGVEEICPDCGKKWQSECVDTTYFCPGCGRSVKWE